MKLEEFYAELKKLYENYPGSLLKVMDARFGTNAVLSIVRILSGLPKRYWIKELSIADILFEASSDLMLRKDKMDILTDVKEALKNITQEDLDREFEEIKRLLKGALRS
jgi:hypothetical protein